MSKLSLSRRDLARLTVAGAAGAMLAATSAQGQTPDAPTPLNTTPDEGAALTEAVRRNVGYPLTETQAKEVEKALKGYPGPFAKARAFEIPDDIGPAWTPDTPGVPPRKGRGR